MEQKIIIKKSTTNNLKTLLAAGIIAATPLGYAEDFTLSVDKYYSPYMGADWMIAGLRAYEALDDILFSGTAGKMCPGDTYIRGGKMLLDFTFSSFETVLQHEIFGHGARVREFHLSGQKYKINVFSGTTYYSNTGYNALDVNARAAIASGGVEGTSILAQQMELSLLKDNIIDRRDAMLYLVSTMDQTVYAFGTTGSWFHPDNDAQLYINQVNAWYSRVNNPLTSKKLQTYAVWDWLNPMLYLSGYSLFNYLWYGDPYVCFDGWHIGNMRFMPTTHMLLAPYGPELQLKLNLFTPNDRYIGIYLRTGRTGGINSYGIDIAVNPMGQWLCINWSNMLSAWYQPHLLKHTYIELSGNKYGFADFLRGSIQLNKYTAAWSEIGYKSSGFLQGTPLSRNWVWRLGVTFSLDVCPKGEKLLCPPVQFPVGPCD